MKKIYLHNRITLYPVMFAIITLAMSLFYTACQGAVRSGGNTNTIPNSYNTTTGEGLVGGVAFKILNIQGVTNATLGHHDNAENREHTVTLTPYRIGETAVTQELWEAVMGVGSNPSHFNGTAGKEPASGEVQGKRPVECVSWYDCIAFCNELTKKVNGGSDTSCVYSVDGHAYNKADATAKKTPTMDMSKKGFRLPTEAEWEWAAKGGTENKWAGTNEEALLKNYAWYKNEDGGDADGKTHEVKKKLPNGYGLYDMSGNVYEWCWDWHNGGTPEGGKTDPTGNDSGSRRVGRGGSWKLNSEASSCAFRGEGAPDRKINSLGLRLTCRP
jgi:hypothetical protein